MKRQYRKFPLQVYTDTDLNHAVWYFIFCLVNHYLSIT